MPTLLAPPRATTLRLTSTLTRLAAPPSLRLHRRPLSTTPSRPNAAITTTPVPSPSPETPDSDLLPQQQQHDNLPPLPPSRWISDLRARIGKCLIFGCNERQVAQAAGVLRVIATEWKGLLAGSEGFLTGGRRGIEGREVAWGEMDTFGHVNNVNYYRYAESARVNWITNFAVHVDPRHREEWHELMSPKSTGLIMKSLKADFKFPLVYPDKISVYHKLTTPPPTDPSTTAPSSFRLDCVVLSHQHRRVACRLEEDIVVYDYRAAGKAPMPGFMLDVFAQTWAMQERVMREARGRIQGLYEAVEGLEGETWAREGAVEEVGGRK